MHWGYFLQFDISINSNNKCENKTEVNCTNLMSQNGPTRPTITCRPLDIFNVALFCGNNVNLLNGPLMYVIDDLKTTRKEEEERLHLQ